MSIGLSIRDHCARLMAPVYTTEAALQNCNRIKFHINYMFTNTLIKAHFVCTVYKFKLFYKVLRVSMSF